MKATKALALVLDEAPLRREGPAAYKGTSTRSRRKSNEKNLQFFYDYRAVNGFYIYGGRKKPFGVVNFPAEFKKLRKMIRQPRRADLGRSPRAKTFRPRSTMAATGEFTDDRDELQERSRRHVARRSRQKSFTARSGLRDQLLRLREADFPTCRTRSRSSFDNKGRLWVSTPAARRTRCTFPGTPPNDKILIFEDTNGDGKADKQTVFADGLLPADRHRARRRRASTSRPSRT